jgi:ADP-heptose:LPS heptosyltransferase
MINSEIKKQQPYSGLIRNSSYLTDLFPDKGGRFIDSFVYSVGGSKMITSLARSSATTKILSIEKLDRILVVSDLNIGDAVVTQAVISGIRDFLPQSRIDYIITRSASDLITGNNEITNSYPVFTGRPFPNINDFFELRRIVSENRYDLVFNFCPLFSRKRDFGEVNIIHGHLAIGPEMIKNEISSSETNHVIFQTNLFINKLLSNKFSSPIEKSFKGVSVYISDSAAAKSGGFMCRIKLRHPDRPLVYFNPDASSPYTTMPLKYQIDIIKQLAEREYNILLGCGYSSKGIEKSILSSLPVSSSDNIILVPYSTSLTEMAAIVDICDVYLGGDTGPLHIAAAKKVSSSGNISFRNRTAIFSVFGATPARIYGYDSGKQGFLAANQQAPSRVYAASSPCQNITCVDKKNKICKFIRCFESLDTEKIIKDIALYLEDLKDIEMSNNL